MTFLVSHRSVFSTRLLLAALLLFGSEILAWSDPPGRPLLEWLLILTGYFALSAVLLDFIVRYRLRDLFGILVLSGLYSLSAALVINPHLAFADMPRTLVTRIMGAHALIAAEMIGLFLLLTGASEPRTRRYLFIGSLVVGLAWGFWVNGWPLDVGFGPVSLPTMLAFGVGGLLLIGVLARYAASFAGDETLSPDSLRLSRVGWGGVVLVGGTLFIIRLLQEPIDPGALILTTLLLILSWAIIWFRGRTKGNTLLDGHFPPVMPPVSMFLIAAVLFLAIAIFVFNLPPIRVSDITPITVIGLGFTAYGLAWLPTVSLVLGGRAYLRQIQTQKL